MTPTELQAACESIARAIGDRGNVTITVGYAHSMPMFYVAVSSGGGRNELLNINSFEDALSRARKIVAGWRAKEDAAEREYASWREPVLLAAAE